MKFLRLLVVFAIVLAGLGQVALARSADPLFVNLSTDDNLRANMAIAISKEMLKQGHPVTIFLNSQAVQIADKNNPRYAMQQQKLGEFISKGGKVYIDQTCSEFLHVNRGLCVPGAQFLDPDVPKALFKPNTRTLSW